MRTRVENNQTFQYNHGIQSTTKHAKIDRTLSHVRDEYTLLKVHLAGTPADLIPLPCINLLLSLTPCEGIGFEGGVSIARPSGLLWVVYLTLLRG